MMNNWSHKSVKEVIKKNEGNNPFDYIRSEAKKLVIRAIEQGWDGPPFNPTELAKILKIQTVPSEFIKDARISIQQGNPLIEYNPKNKFSRINFSVAHEIAHTLFPDWKEKVRNRESKKNDDQRELEMLCDIGASEILLPYSRFSIDANSLPTNLNNLFKLADIYEASLESVFLRYCEVINRPCSIFVCSTKGDVLKVEYSKSSRRSTLEIPKQFEIPNDSIAYFCKQPGHTDENIESWNLFDGESFHVHAVGLSPLKGTTSHRVGIFINEDQQDLENYSFSFKKVNGDATKPRGSGSKTVVQVVNTIGAMGAGFGKAVSKKWPKAESELKELKKEDDGLYLGRVNLVEVEDDIEIFQIVAQQGIKNKLKSSLIDYQALRQGLQMLADHAIQTKKSIHMPPIGSGFAGGNWKLIEGMIYDELVTAGLEVTIYFLPGTKKKISSSPQRTLFSD